MKIALELLSIHNNEKEFTIGPTKTTLSTTLSLIFLFCRLLKPKQNSILQNPTTAKFDLEGAWRHGQCF